MASNELNAPPVAASRHQFVELDGLRGVAAMGVVLLHLGPYFFAPSNQILWQRHAFLAVDFFMLLSGFVIAHAYGDRLTQRGNRLRFCIDRAIRLYPLLILGAIAGTLTLFLAQPAPTGPHALLYGVLGMIPMPVYGAKWAFPSNMPAWSLFWELLLNGAFAFAAPYLTTRRLFLAIASVALLTIAVGAYHHDIDTGATLKGFIESGPRVTLGFLLGIAMLRVHRGGLLAGGGHRWWCAIALVACLFGVDRLSPLRLPYEIAVVLVLFPLLLLTAAGSKPLVPAIAKLSGVVSYPLYILQMPLGAALLYAMGTAHIQPSVVTGSVVIFGILPLMSYAVLQLYDLPARAALRRRFGSVRHRSA